MPYGRDDNDTFEFNIVEHIGVLSVKKSNWKKEFNIVEWNGNPAKYDIREWDPDHEHMGRGITMDRAETEKLSSLLKQYFSAGKGKLDAGPLVTDEQSEVAEAV